MLSADKLVIFITAKNSLQNKGAYNVHQLEYINIPTPDCPP